jgi:hypothetical protein
MQQSFFVKVLVEGQTEATLIERFLAQHFQSQQIYVQAIVVTNRQAYGKYASKKGGVPKYPRVKKELLNLLNDSSTRLVTTMFDFYALPDDFPGMKDSEATQGTCYQQIAYVENALQADIDNRRFMAYLSLHEVEALLFTQPDSILKAVGIDDSTWSAKLQSIRDSFQSPEEINHENPPSKRIEAHVASYRKVSHIVPAAEFIGLPAIRADCPHFDSWLQHIEALAT